MSDIDSDWLADDYETSGDYDLNHVRSTEDVNNNGRLDEGEDVGLKKRYAN